MRVSGPSDGSSAPQLSRVERLLCSKFSRGHSWPGMNRQQLSDSASFSSWTHVAATHDLRLQFSLELLCHFSPLRSTSQCYVCHLLAEWAWSRWRSRGRSASPARTMRCSTVNSSRVLMGCLTVVSVSREGVSLVGERDVALPASISTVSAALTAAALPRRIPVRALRLGWLAARASCPPAR